jgi:hypothetical protein
MNRRIFCLGLFIFALPLLTFALPGPREKQWQKVDEAMRKGLPQTAIKELEPIIAAALKDKAYPEAIKAICRKIALEGNIQGNKPEERISRMKAAIAKAPAEMVPVMDAVLANWYWHFFQQNRWRFVQRTQTAEPTGPDILTWTLPRILAEIDAQFTKALAGDKLLKATPIADYDALLEKGNVPDSYRPTLYDFIAYNALAFYATGEQAGARAEDTFELTPDSPIFAPVADFLKWDVKTPDAESLTARAVKLCQQLLRFHENDKDRTAFLEADLSRLVFGHNKAVGENKNAPYKAALERLADANPKHEVGVRALYHWAVVLHGEEDFVRALALAAKGAQALPDSHGGRLCHNLVQQIQAKEASISTERVWNQPWPTIQVRYRNVTKVYFRAVPYDFLEKLQGTQYRPEYLTPAEQQAVLNKKPARTWSEDLPATQDYHQRVEKFAAPKDLKPGFYYLVASHDPKFGTTDNVISYTAFWVSKLALVTRVRQGEGSLEGFVLDALTGEPVAGAEVKAWWHAHPNARGFTQPTQTNGNGYFRFDGADNNKRYLVYAKFQGQEIHSASDHYLNRYNFQPLPSTQTIFFTDRALYRPGQTIQYRGLCISINQANDNYDVIGKRAVTVVFRDHNNKELARAQHVTNDYGTFNGSFTAPSGKATGTMWIRTEGEPNGQANVNVEEYKRPKFQVTLEKPKEGAKLNGPVTVAGKALAYTGAAVDNAKVRFRVVREVRYPPWYGWRYWWRPRPAQPAQEIAHGFARTAANGTFKVDFVARPDLKVPAKDEPTFHYAIHADVTDTTGETRSGQVSINVGYTALQATLSAPDWLTSAKEVEVTARTTTLDGEGQAVEGTVKVYRLKQPEKVHRAPLLSHYYYPPVRVRGKDKEPAADPSNPNSWELGEVAAEKAFKTDKAGNAKLPFQLGVGAYRVLLETKDRYGKKVTARLPLQVIDPAAQKLAIKVPNVVASPTWTVEPGQEFRLVWGSGYDTARAFIEIEHRRKLLKSFWTDAGRTQAEVKQAVTEAMRGGFTVRVTMVRENRAYLESRHVDVPWSNKDLTVRWEHHTSKLEPGRKETWTAVITGPKAQKAVAEMVATLYDESLDAYLKHNWITKLNVFRTDYSNLRQQFENVTAQAQPMRGSWASDYKTIAWTYRHFPQDIGGNFWAYEWGAPGNRFGFRGGAMPPMAGAMPGRADLAEGANLAFARDGAAVKGMAKAEAQGRQLAADRAPAAGLGGPGGLAQQPPPAPDLSQVSPRKNLNETAFFFPRLLSTKDGEVRLQFVMPEALTKWKFMAFAHDKELRSGSLQDSVVTARDLMVQPNPPRFLREGDLIEFTVKVTNQSDAEQTGVVRLTFADALTDKSVDAALANTNNEKPFTVPAKESRSFAWRLKVPDGLGLVAYKAVGASGKLSDGEEGYLPVLSRRILVTESLVLPIRGPATRKWDFKRLAESGKSDTLQSKTLTVQAVSNPSWYAVMALPYLMEFPYECTEQTFNRLYANALARYIAASDPRIRKVFNQWKGTPALDSPLEKNKDLRAVALEETPWVKQAESESQARRNVGILFDDNRLNQETAQLQKQLADMQLGDGAWPWFPGGRANDYITLYITTGFGRLRQLGVKIDDVPAVKSLTRLDGWADRIYRDILKHGKKDDNHLSPTIALYLYGRSFFLLDKGVGQQHKEAIDYWLGQARTHWLKLANRQSQAHLALALDRFGDKKAAQGIMASIKERSVTDEEMGMFWRDQELSWWWYRAPIETQAMMIEAFEEVMNDTKAVEECKVWLLKQKQTRDWKTTKATADAVYALLLRGKGNPLASTALVELKLGDVAIKPEKVEAGTGFYEKRFVGSDIKPSLAAVTMKKVDEGVSWGSVTWQYLEDVGKVSGYEGTPLKLKKALYTKVYTKKGPVLQPVQGALKVGDELVVRVIVKVDRDMEYVHLKDARGSGTEPVNVLSRYRYQDGLAYYESTKDTASHFFIDYLPKGTYVFEYATRVQLRGQYQTGMAEIQCMYAPEFNSHSESFLLKVE